jgi:RNA recognition motif-containing protein
MPFSMSEESVRTLFSPHGEIKSVNVIMDRDTGRPRGFAFIEMSDEDARKAMSALDGKEVDGRNLKINEAKAREDRANGRGGRGGGGNRY